MFYVGLSFVPSSEWFEVHAFFFSTFLLTSILSMTLTRFYLLAHCGYQVNYVSSLASVSDPGPHPLDDPDQVLATSSHKKLTKTYDLGGRYWYGRYQYPTCR